MSVEKVFHLTLGLAGALVIGVSSVVAVPAQQIEQIERITLEEAEQVYNLSIEGNQNYYVTVKGVLVHNCDVPIAGRIDGGPSMYDRVDDAILLDPSKGPISPDHPHYPHEWGHAMGHREGTQNIKNPDDMYTLTGQGETLWNEVDATRRAGGSEQDVIDQISQGGYNQDKDNIKEFFLDGSESSDQEVVDFVEEHFQPDSTTRPIAKESTKYLCNKGSRVD